MYRHELNYSDDQLVELVKQAYNIEIAQLRFVDTGSFFAFEVITKVQQKYFLKVYPIQQTLVPVAQPTATLLNNIGRTLQQLRQKFNIHNLSYCIPTKTGQFCFATSELLLVLFEYVTGFHPTYLPNQLKATELAKLLFQLHQVPIDEFSYFEREAFAIAYPLGLTAWLSHEITPVNKIFATEMLTMLKQHEKILKKGLSVLISWQAEFAKQAMTLVITHGDAHHFNVLQNNHEVWLVDWDGIKLAPIERDLWHYKNAPLINEYQKLNPYYQINAKLCDFYQLQRFLEDIRYYLDQVLLGRNTTIAQAEQDQASFLGHWGWEICLNSSFLSKP